VTYEVNGVVYRAGKRIWTEAEDARMRTLYPEQPTAAVAVALGRSIASVYQRADKLGLKKSAAFLASPASCRTTGRQGIGTRFVKGQAPANKGLRRPGWSAGRMRETQFKKGVLNGVAAARFKPIGSTRTIDGYLYRKVSTLPGPWTRNWTLEHYRVWTAAHGPVPAGHAICFKNGDKTDVRLDNLECLTKAAVMARNTVHNLPKPLAQTIQLLGALKRQIRKRDHAAHD